MSTTVQDPIEMSDYDKNVFKENNPLMWRERKNTFFSSVIDGFQFKVAYIGRDLRSHDNKYYRCIFTYNGEEMMNFSCFDLENIVARCLKESRYHVRQREGQQGYDKLADRILEDE